MMCYTIDICYSLNVPDRRNERMGLDISKAMIMLR